MSSHSCQTAVKCEAEVQPGGRVEVTVPFAAGSRVVLFVVEEQDILRQDLLMPRKARLDSGTIRWTTRIGTVLEQGEIVLIPIPFTDLSSQKRRPVIVVSNSDYHRKIGDMLVVAMTSNPAKFDFGFKIDSVDLEKGRLNHPGSVHVDRIYTMSQSLIVKRFGKVNESTLERIRIVLMDLVSSKG